MSRKPASTAYLPNERPPLVVTILSALQHVAITASFLIFPLIIAREANLPVGATESMLAWAMLVLALSSALQAFGRGSIGSGYLAPGAMTAVFLSPAMEAVRLGGLALMAGMTLFSGVVQVVLARCLFYLRSLLPTELAGVIIFLAGISNGVVGLRYLLAPDNGGLPGLPHWIVAAVTLIVVIGLNVWSRGGLGLACALFGMIAGYIAAIPLGVLPWSTLTQAATLPVVGLPGISHLGWSFDATLLVPFFLAAVANTVQATALLTASQRTLDADWQRPDMKPIGHGVLADGLAVAASGVVSVFPVNVSAASVGLVAATGVASRRVAYATSIIFVLLAFLPVFTRLLVVMPAPVVGATLIFASSTLLKTGVELIAARLYDNRKTMVVGLSIISGIAVEAFPATFRLMPAVVQPLTVSTLVFGGTVGLVLSLLFSLGQRRTNILVLEPAAPDLIAIANFVETCGAGWGARREIVKKAEQAVQELVETVTAHCNPRGLMTLSATFEELQLELELRYAGEVLPMVRKRPSLDEIAASEDGARQLAAFLLHQHYATHMTSSERRGDCLIRLQFDH